MVNVTPSVHVVKSIAGIPIMGEVQSDSGAVTFDPAAIKAAQLALAIAAEPVSDSRRRPRYGLDVSPSPCPKCNKPLRQVVSKNGPGWACGCKKGGA